MLKVGDIVKIREDLSYDMEKVGINITAGMFTLKGQTATVAKADTDNTVKLDVDDGKFWWHENWLEKLNKFSVGDKVVVCYKVPEGVNEAFLGKLLELISDMTNLPKPAEYNGKIGTVVSLKEDGANIEFESEEKPVWMPNVWLKEHVHKFKEGDKIRIARSGEGLTDCAGGWYSYMKEYVGDIVTIGARNYDYDNEIVGYLVKGNSCIWDERLLELVTEECFTGKVVCINDNTRCDITKGRIYNFIDGKALDDAGDSFPCGNFMVHNVDELNDLYKDCCDKDAPQFIEIVE